MNPEPGFPSGPEDTVDAALDGTLTPPVVGY